MRITPPLCYGNSNTQRFGQSMNKDPFPRHIVSGDTFCNRVEERARLSKLLSRGTHIWLQAHRRHGKSSLLMQVGIDMHKSGEKFVQQRCHLLFSSDAESIIKQLVKTTARLMGQVAEIHAKEQGYSKKEAILEYISRQFSKRSLDVKLERGMPSISFKDYSGSQPLDTLREALSELDKYARKVDTRVILIIDEFQELGKTKGGVEIESAIRDQLELAESIVFVFCGSERALMTQSLNDQKRPLYNHTKPFPLERIRPEHYKGHFNRLSHLNWGAKLSNAVIDRIFHYTQCHPYYVNSLCSDLWLLDDLPVVDDVDYCWLEVIEMAEREEKEFILKLGSNEKKVLAGISSGITSQLRSNEAAIKMRIASGSVQRAVDSLIKNDVIEKIVDGSYRIINPIIAEIARRNS